MKININPERFTKNKTKDEIIESHADDKYRFKEEKNLKKLKERINDMFRKHFDADTPNKETPDVMKTHVTTKVVSRFDKKRSKPKKLISLLYDLIIKLGYEYNPRDLNKRIMTGVSFLTSFFSLVILIFVIANGKSLDVLVTFLLVIWTLVYAAAYLLMLLIIFAYLDIRTYQYIKQIEEALPDFLQLASANISAGMTVDRALWYAVRPKFGILAKEMEDVAKSTIAGEDLEKALTMLGSKYESRILKETMNLIVEGISSGGEMAELLSKLSANIKETQLMKKEIGASVTTYAIFIGIATVMAAPVLFALSTELLYIIQKIFGSIHLSQTAGVSSLFSFNFSGESIAISDFKIFSIVVLIISSFFSAAIISVIRKGSVKDGLKTIPLFMVVSVLLYYASCALFQILMGSLF